MRERKRFGLTGESTRNGWYPLLFETDVESRLYVHLAKAEWSHVVGNGLLSQRGSNRWGGWFEAGVKASGICS